MGYKTWLTALPLTGEKTCLLELQDEVTIGHFNHIYATKKIVLEKDVLTADRVYISDNLHGYSDIHIPIKNQPIIQHGEVVIGESSWLGENVCVLEPRIGKHCVIGANSVVTKDIPGYSVAVGVPEKVIKKHDIQQNMWINIKKIYKMRWGGIKKLFILSKRFIMYLWRKPQYKRLSFSASIHRVNSITPRYVECGMFVYIGFNARIQGICQYNNICFTPSIILEDGVSIQQNIHLTCANKVIIGRNTAIAANVTITDIHHPYVDISIPIERQNIEVGFVEIGEDCKIYNNAVILPNVRIGKHVTVGANSVVNRSLPDYCVAVGIPAKIIKRYDFATQSWRKTDPQGNFVEK